ncbi:hypothetical protein DS745_18725 [Anaerobacillus alkaliphilus]|uniref:Uncharacterized protein n=1 Tax=Anaerobacillus alkaliphilus TaxID=1548597 RepID=A0A4Q0VSG4_9BACI|nr:hypothetical protein [Anaerobacillus alkaliphilus]RXI98360.1 hypothetical protein DS745_18725 [Anaerobacillus alkaliphilus]
MEFPFDLSIIWLSLLLSLLLLMAYIVQSGYLPSFKRHKLRVRLNESLRNIEAPINVLSGRLHIIFRKIPTKELGSNLIDEDHCFLLKKQVIFSYIEEEVVYGN